RAAEAACYIAAPADCQGTRVGSDPAPALDSPDGDEYAVAFMETGRADHGLRSTVPTFPEEMLMAAKKPAKQTARKASTAFMKPMQTDAALAEVVGSKPLPRTEVTKKLWAYIKKQGLQDPKNRRMINADAKLGAIFGGKKQVSMFEMTKLVNKHLK